MLDYDENKQIYKCILVRRPENLNSLNKKWHWIFSVPYNGYNDTIDATVSNVFSTAAFRFGHAAIRGNSTICEYLFIYYSVLPEGRDDFTLI